ncbi:Serine/threonine-protein kinase plk2 [Mortierella sp. GBA35]|nr:Serine/threonine-protein kinase plk2 [Mortierella sp. GBA35]
MTNQSNHDNTTTGMSTIMTQTSSNDNTTILATATVNVNRNIYVDEFGEKYEHESNLSKAKFHTIDKIKDKDGNRFKLKTYRKSRVKKNKIDNEVAALQLINRNPNQHIVDLLRVFEDSTTINLMFEIDYENTLRDLLTARRRLSSPEVCLLGGQLVKGVGRKGNDGYLSPEYVQRGKFTCALDVWATGCILFEMLEDHPPGSTTTVRKGRDAFAGVRMPSDAKELIKQVLEPNPERRMSLKEVTQHTFLKDGWRPESLTREVFRRAPVAPAPAPTDRKRALDCDLADRLSSNDQKKRAKATKKEVNTLPNQEQQAQE